MKFKVLGYLLIGMALLGCEKTKVSGNRNYTLYGESGGKQVVVDVSIQLDAYGVKGIDDFDSILSQYDDSIKAKLNLSLASLPGYENKDLLKQGTSETIDLTLSTLDQKILDRVTFNSATVTYADFTKAGAQRSLENFMAGFPGLYSGGSCDGTDGGGGNPPDGDITCTLSLLNPLPGQAQFVQGSFDVKGEGGKLDTSTTKITPQYIPQPIPQNNQQ